MKPKRRVPPVAPRKPRRANVTRSQQAVGKVVDAPAQPRHIGQDEIIAERRAKALAYRKGGASYRVIAEKLGIDVATAWGDVQAELGALRDIAQQTAEEIRELECRRLDDWTLAMTPLAQQGNIKAVFALVKLQERRAKLLGLDAASKVEHSGAIDLTSSAAKVDALLADLTAPAAEGES